jgi:hypothetical protein
MMKVGPQFALFVALFSLSNFVLIAQVSEQGSHAPDGNSRLTINNISIPPISSAPFTAIVKAEVIRHLEDGTTLTIKNHRTVARDSSGRIFQERRLLTEDGDIRETPVTQLEFSDPTTHQLYICDPTGRACALHPYFEPSSLTSVLFQQSDKGGPQSVNLGSAIINGVDTIGTRETSVISPTGTGSHRTFSVTKEFWYSSQLGINMVTRRFDPRFGTQIFEVTNLILGEPDAKLFELPPGATILQQTPQPPSR